jgi:transcription elongation factor GreB
VEKTAVSLVVSKAFTRESDDARADELPEIRLPPTGTKNHLTKEGADRLGRRLMELREERRFLSEQKDNLNTQPALRRLEAESQKLQSILDSAIIAEPPSDPGKIGLGAWVRLRGDDGEEEDYQIVGVAEANPGEGRISSASPLGRVLLARRTGEIVHFQTPAGPRELTILNVRYGNP